MIAIRQMNFDPEINAQGEINNLPSETLQGQSLTVREVLERFTQGISPSLDQNYYYDDVQDDAFDAYDVTLEPDFDLSDTDGIEEHINALKQLKTPQAETLENKPNVSQNPPNETATED